MSRVKLIEVKESEPDLLKLNRQVSHSLAQARTSRYTCKNYQPRAYCETPFPPFDKYNKS